MEQFVFPRRLFIPVTVSQASLAPGQMFFAPPQSALNSQIPASFTTGYDSTMTVSPAVVPARFGWQKVTITMTLADARYAMPPDGNVGITVNLGSDVPGVFVEKTTDPDNLDQGEILQTFSPPEFPFGLFQWRLGYAQLNKQYTFTAKLGVSNPSEEQFEYRPHVIVSANRDSFLCDGCAGSAVTVKDPTLDGDVPDSGGVTFSVAETNHTWTPTYSDSFVVDYQGTAQVTIVAKPEDGQPVPINAASQRVNPAPFLRQPPSTHNS
jgi:hypothetical protein